MPIAQFRHVYDPVGTPKPPLCTGRPLGRTVTVQLPPEQRSGSHWICSKLRLAGRPAELQALFLSTVGARVRVFVNDVEVGASATIDDSSQATWNYPVLIVVPNSVLRPGINRVDLLASPYATGLVSVGPTRFGSQYELRRLYERTFFLRITGPQLISIITIIVGLVSLIIWLRRRTERLFLWFAVACALWVIRNVHYYVRTTWPNEDVFVEVTFASLHWLTAVLVGFAFRVAREHRPRLEAAAFGYAVLSTLAIVLVPKEVRWIVADISFLPLLLVAAAMAIYVSWRAVQMPRVEMTLLAIATIANFFLGLHDMAILLGLMPIEWRNYLAPYGALIFATVVGWSLVDGFVRAHSAFEGLNADLDRRLRAREQELTAQHDRIVQLERQQAVSGERQRILQDIHDGLGSSLISSMYAVESGRLSTDAVSDVLRQCVDDLRLSIDTLKPDGKDLLLVLASLRYRMESRLAAAGIALDWQVDPGAVSPTLTPGRVLHLLRIVQEAMTNTLKHSGASKITVRYGLDGARGWYYLQVQDNGRGFTPGANPGLGLENMHRRAQQADVALAVDSDQRGTSIRLTLLAAEQDPASIGRPQSLPNATRDASVARTLSQSSRS